jgi:hypothetical protein
MRVIQVIRLALLAVELVVDFTAELDLITRVLPAEELLRIELEIVIIVESIIDTFFVGSRLELFKALIFGCCEHQVSIQCALALFQIIHFVTNAFWSSWNFRGFPGKKASLEGRVVHLKILGHLLLQGAVS